MAPNKFEKHIRKQLEEREIQPSVHAWNRISEQLEGDRSQKSKNFFKYGIAAGFIGLLVVSIWYFNSDSVIDVQTVVKETPINSEEKEQKPERMLEENIQGNEIVAKDELEAQRTITTVSPQKLDKVMETPAVHAGNKNNLVEKVSLAPTTSEELINSKITELITQVDLLETGNTTVSDAEIDSLLRQAQQEILAIKIFRKDNSVDAMALLADVENELDKSFRDQIFDALKDGFVKVRTAVADRNK